MKFTAFERKLQGTGASRRLRNAGKVPGIVYGAGTPTMIELDHNALFFALKKVGELVLHGVSTSHPVNDTRNWLKVPR